MRRTLKWIGIGLGSLVGLIVLAILVLSLLGRAKLDHKFEAPPAAALPVNSASLEFGRHVMGIHGCDDCHGQDLGGRTFLDIPPGLIVAPNITSGRGGVTGSYTDRDWDHAIRYGLRPDGSWLLPFMPSRLFSGLSDEDTAALIDYLKSVPPVDREQPPTKLRVPGYVMVGLPTFDLDEILPKRAGPLGPPPEPGPTAAYGRYIASTTCVHCHGDDLRGGKHPAPEAPPATSLAAAGSWSVEEFGRAVREGVVPGGRRLTPFMPVTAFRDLTDVEVAALHAYLRSLPPARDAGATR